MSVKFRLKQLTERLPEDVGRRFTWVPYSFRVGLDYLWSWRKIQRSDRLKRSELSKEVFKQLFEITSYAYENVTFYRKHYQAAGFKPEQLKNAADWERVPIINKNDLQNTSLDERCVLSSGMMRFNTGGTSGQPLEFSVDKKAFAREWAYMHDIWKARGYHPAHLKLTFRGKHFDTRIPLRYNAVYNEFIVNSNCSMDQIANAVSALPRDRVIRWLHGYPSLVAEFADVLENGFPEIADSLRSRLFGVLLGSEFPAPPYRELIARVLSSNIVSWYGHSEMSVLARETAFGVYESLPTYGYAEAVRNTDGSRIETRLVCTSLHNRVHPFIRYDTGDKIKPLSQAGPSLAFSIVEGRIGDFIIDRRGEKRGLTAIIFGRHHKAFGKIRHLQVHQNGPGKVTFLVTLRTSFVDPEEIRAGFDFDDLDLDWCIEIVREPIRTPAGKIQLKVKSIQAAAQSK